MGASEDLLKGADGILEGDELALITSEDLGNLEGLRHETLDLTSTLDLNWKNELVQVKYDEHARTVSLSSSDNSSIPKIAMISWSDL